MGRNCDNVENIFKKLEKYCHSFLNKLLKLFCLISCHFNLFEVDLNGIKVLKSEKEFVTFNRTC